MTLLVSDEEDLVAHQIGYHLVQGVDFVIVTANRASEPVLSQVEGFVERGLARLVREDRDVFAQNEWVTRMARMAAEEYGADWVLNADADEFFWPETGTFKEILTAVPSEYGALDMPVFHFLPGVEEEGFFADRLTVRETRSLKPNGRAVFVKAVHRGVADVEVSMGNHRVAGSGLDLLSVWHPIVGLHFPKRSFEQFERHVARDLRADSHGWMKRYRQRLDLHTTGGLREAYEAGVPGEAEVCEGVQSGRLVVDERLKRFLKSMRTVGSASELSVDPRRVEELRLEARRAIVEFERHPLYLEGDRLRERLERAERRERRLRHRAERSEAQRKELKSKLAAARARRSGLSGAVSALAARLRAPRGRGPWADGPGD